MPSLRLLTLLPRKLNLSLLATIALLLILVLVNQPLRTGSAPQGIVSFQMAATADQSMAIIRSWRDDGIMWASVSLWLDFLFVPAYLATLILLTNHLTRDRPGVRERKVARWVKALFVTAGCGDLAENVLLLNNMDPPTDMVSLSATICALAKFTGLMLGAAGLVIIRAARRHPFAHE